MADLSLRLHKDMLVVDGDLALSLESMGLDSTQCIEFYNLTDEESVQTAHKFFKQAGADCLCTNTLQANKKHLEAFDLASSVAAINKAGVKLAKSLRPQHVLACVGPLGILDYPSLDISLLGPALQKDIETKKAEVIDIYREQLAALTSQSPDGIFFKTFTSLEEAKCAVSLAKTLTDIPILLSFSFTDELRLPLSDEPLSEVLESFADIGADVYGFNCMSHELTVQCITLAQEKTDAPLLAMPSAGIPQINSLGEKKYPCSSNDFARFAQEYYDLGVQFIGGCCGTQAAHIAAIFAQVHKKDVKVK